MNRLHLTILRVGLRVDIVIFSMQNAPMKGKGSLKTENYTTRDAIATPFLSYFKENSLAEFVWNGFGLTRSRRN